MKYFQVIIVIVVLLFAPLSVKAAKLHFRTQKDSYKTGESGFATINVDTEGKTANAFSGTILFDPSIVEVSNISKDRSIITMWAQSATIDSINGRITFKGITFNPGYKGNPGRLFGFDFKAKAPGKMDFKIANFLVLANDGRGTPIATKGISRAITVSGASQTKSGIRIASSTHPSQSRWYAKKNILVAWSVADKDIETVAYVFDKNPKTEPGAVSLTNADSASQKNVTSGVWYVHVKAKGKTKGWFPTEHFKINVDLDPPLANTITVLPRLNESILPTIRAKAKDALSGVASYEVLVNGKIVVSAASIDSLKLKGLNIGKNTVEVRVTDAAGNSRSDKISVLYNPLVAPKQNSTTKTPVVPSVPTPSKPKVIIPIKSKTPVRFD